MKPFGTESCASLACAHTGRAAALALSVFCGLLGPQWRAVSSPSSLLPELPGKALSKFPGDVWLAPVAGCISQGHALGRRAMRVQTPASSTSLLDSPALALLLAAAAAGLALSGMVVAVGLFLLCVRGCVRGGLCQAHLLPLGVCAQRTCCGGCHSRAICGPCFASACCEATSGDEPPTKIEPSPL